MTDLVASAADRTDPRIARTRRVVIDAVAAILAEEGAGAVTHQRVAERAGVGRATLYRHWPSAADLLYDALGAVEEPLLRRGVGPLAAWLGGELRRAAVEIGQPSALQFQAVLIGRAQLDPAAAELRDQLVARNAAILTAAVTRAVERGELTAEPDPLDLLAALLGPLIFRVVLEGRPASDDFVDAVIDCALAPWRPADPGGDR